jgi:hypothetical protein
MLPTRKNGSWPLDCDRNLNGSSERVVLRNGKMLPHRQAKKKKKKYPTQAPKQGNPISIRSFRPRKKSYQRKSLKASFSFCPLSFFFFSPPQFSRFSYLCYGRVRIHVAR